jgi:type VI secretion system secreted protein VgrG
MNSLELRLFGDSQVSAVRARIEERISSPFRADVIVRSARPDLDFDTIVGAPAQLIVSVGDRQRIFTGYVRDMMFARAASTAVFGIPTELTTYVVTLAPRLSLLDRRAGARTHLHLTAKEIVQKYLVEWSIPHRFELDDEAYPVLDYRVQYDESDFAFVSRILEESGISYTFGEREVERGVYETELVLTDRPHARKEQYGEPLRVVDTTSGSILDVAREALGALSGDPFVSRVRVADRVKRARFVFRDFDARQNLSASLGGHAEHEEQTKEGNPKPPSIETSLEHFAYKPGLSTVSVKREGQVSPIHARDAASRALEAERAQKWRVDYATNAIDLAPGAVFSIARGDLGAKRPLLVLGSVMSVRAGARVSTMGWATFADNVYRPANRTIKPRIRGLQSARVVGEGDAILADDMGRVRLRFPWDREGEADSARTPWVRVSQPTAGAGWGGHAIPRAGHEVLVDYQEGDPDKPVIVGRVHGASKPVPHSLPLSLARTAWRTQSLGEGYNELAFEDTAGREQVALRAQRGLQKLVKADESSRVGRHRAHGVTGSRRAIVAGQDTLLVGTKRRVAIADESGAVTANVELEHGKITLRTTGAEVILEGGTIRVRADQIALHAGGECRVIGGPTVSLGAAPEPFAPAPGDGESIAATAAKYGIAIDKVSVAATIPAGTVLYDGTFARVASSKDFRVSISATDKDLTIALDPPLPVDLTGPLHNLEISKIVYDFGTATVSEVGLKQGSGGGIDVSGFAKTAAQSVVDSFFGKSLLHKPGYRPMEDAHLIDTLKSFGGGASESPTGETAKETAKSSGFGPKNLKDTSAQVELHATRQIDAKYDGSGVVLQPNVPVTMSVLTKGTVEDLTKKKIVIKSIDLESEGLSLEHNLANVSTDKKFAQIEHIQIKPGSGPGEPVRVDVKKMKALGNFATGDMKYKAGGIVITVPPQMVIGHQPELLGMAMTYGANAYLTKNPDAIPGVDLLKIFPPKAGEAEPLELEVIPPTR